MDRWSCNVPRPRKADEAELPSHNLQTAAPLGASADRPLSVRLSCPVLDSQHVLPAVLPGARAINLPASSSSNSLAPVTPAAEDPPADRCCSPAELGSEAACSTGGRAYVTLLTRSSYLMGVQALSRSLATVGARHPLLVMYTDTLGSAAVDALRAEPCQLLPVERYTPAGSHDPGLYKLELYRECWTKLRMWELEGWDRLVYLDADMILLRNIDHLFDLPPGFYAAPDCMAGRELQEERDACPLFRPDRPHYFNAGLFLMRPCRAELARFDALLAAGEAAVGGYAEQDLLNRAYKGTWKALPPAYNLQKGIRRHHPRLWAASWREAAVLHYTDAKPWHPQHPEHEQYRDLADLWWRAYRGQLLGLSTPTAAWLLGPGSTEAATPCPPLRPTQETAHPCVGTPLQLAAHRLPATRL